MIHSVATIGMFDGVHRGHRLILDTLRDEAARRGAETAVVTFSNHPMTVVNPDRAPALLTPGDEKDRLLTEVGIDRLIINRFDRKMQEMSAHDFLQFLRDTHGVELLLMGYNNRFGHDRTLGFADYVAIGRESGIEIIQAPELRIRDMKVSSTVIRRLLTEGDVATATEMLGRPYDLTGKVVSGRQLGRTIGFPTANIAPESSDKLIPGPGVYACTATLDDGRTFPAMVNIGTRPTVDPTDSTLSIEAHLPGLAEDIYSHSLTLRFIAFIRPEQRFESLEKLGQQLRLDRMKTIELTQPKT